MRAKARDVRVVIYVDDDGKPLYVDVVLPKQRREIGDAQLGVPEKTEEILPEFTVFPEPTHTTVSFNLYDAEVVIKKKLIKYDEGELAYLDGPFPLFNTFMEKLVDAEDPASDPKNWMPVWITSGRGDQSYLALIDSIAFKESLKVVSPFDIPKIYEYNYDKPQRVEVVPNTVHPDWRWMMRKGNICTNLGLVVTPFWTTRDLLRGRRETLEQEAVEQADAEFEAQKGLNDAEAEARDRAEEDRRRPDGRE